MITVRLESVPVLPRLSLSKTVIHYFGSMLVTKRCKRKTRAFRTFSCFGSHIWNSLPQDLRHCSTLSSFKAKLKTFLFSQYFHPNYQFPVSASHSVCMRASVRAHARARACVCVCELTLHELNCYIVEFNFIYNFYTWLIVMFCPFVNALHEWNVTKTNACAHLTASGQ